MRCLIIPSVKTVSFKYNIGRMKYKKLSKEQLIISIDRLTRFKNTRDKYVRVFSDIILSSLSEPRYKKHDLEIMPYSELRDIAQDIINASLGSEVEWDSSVNKKIQDYENSVFNNDKDVQELLNNNINYNSVFRYIDKDSVVNLRWLKSLETAKSLIENRILHCLKFPIEKVLLVEGLTEEILLPAFSRVLGYDFYKHGIQIIPAGGKNQVVKMYYKLSEELKLPIFLLLDKDAEENIKQITPKLRESDKIHLVSCGEFEDLLPSSLIIKTVNSHFENFLTITESDLKLNEPKARILENIFKTKGLHEFKKAEFAKLVRANIQSVDDISHEIRDIILEIFEEDKSLDIKICSC